MKNLMNHKEIIEALLSATGAAMGPKDLRLAQQLFGVASMLVWRPISELSPCRPGWVELRGPGLPPLIIDWNQPRVLSGYTVFRPVLPGPEGE